MLTQNDFEKLEQLFEQLFDKKITPLKDDIHILKNDMSELKSDVSGLKNDVSVLKDDVSTLKGDMSSVKTDISSLKIDIQNVTSTVITEIIDLLTDNGLLQKSLKDLKTNINNKIEFLRTDLNIGIGAHDIRISKLEEISLRQ